MHESDIYAGHGAQYAAAYEILADGCQVPPSFEGFRHLLEQERSQSRYPVTPETIAHQLVTASKLSSL